MAVLARINEIRSQVRFLSAEPRQSAEMLASFFLAPSIEGGVERFNDDPSLHPASLDPNHQDRRAFAGYSEAMKYILHLHDDPHFVYDEGFVRGVHFMMLSHDPEKNPGRWRSGPIGVHRGKTNEILYEAPPAESVPDLMRALMAWLNEKDDVPVIVRAAMAHLTLAKVHPFSDGNGRMARALHTLVLVRDGILDPEFCSIEDYIARHRHRYFDSLCDAGSATWDPVGDPRPFVRFCLTAHLHQAEQVLVHARRMSEVWARVEEEIRTRRLPERLAFALADAALLGEVRNAEYRQWAGGSARRASRDLQMLVDQRLLIRSRKGRACSYRAGSRVQALGEHARAAHPLPAQLDPFGNRMP